MTQEEKDLLLKDLCARLPYKVIVDYGYNAFDIHNGDYVKQGSKCILKCYLLDVFMSPRQNEKGEYIKPYLHPMSSMTEEEKHKLLKFGAITCLKNGEVIDVSCVGFERHADVQDYLNAHHFDYRNLIEKGLAIAVTEENNPYK